MSRPTTPTSHLAQQPYSETLSNNIRDETPRPTTHLHNADHINIAAGPEVDHIDAAQDEASVYSHAIEEQEPTGEPNVQRSASQAGRSMTPSRHNTLQKKSLVSRSNSKRSSRVPSVRDLKVEEKEKYQETEETNSVFSSPVPVTGNPTELLADRFQAWRKVLKDLITYFREVHKTYEGKSKALIGANNAITNSSIPANFMSNGGLSEASRILQQFHRQAVNEANKARDLENDVIMQLTGLRSDLQQKIKEIKGLSGDFKSSAGREQENTKRQVRQFQEALGTVDQNATTSAGKGDPYLMKLSVDKQVEKQIEEENYLHRAYLNLEASGRELESIVVGEIQKAYNVFSGILRREADEAYDVAEKLKEGPLAIPKDQEWDYFVGNDKRMVDPRVPLRQASRIVYPGKDHPAAIEIRSGMLERKSKYLKNYTPGWYVLSPTHLHEFKSADRIAFQAPVMSLALSEQKLGSYSEPGASSHKFMLKGRQSGGMHRGHSWVFRAETHDTMLAWIADIRILTEGRGEERSAFIRRTHARSLSGNSMRPSIAAESEADMEDDEADQQAFSGEQSVRGQSVPRGDDVALGGVTGGLNADAAYDIDDTRSEAGWRPPQRPTPGGRFPSDVDVQRGLQAPLSPDSGHSEPADRDVIAAAATLPGTSDPFEHSHNAHTELQDVVSPNAEQAQPAVGLATFAATTAHPNVFPTHDTMAAAKTTSPAQNGYTTNDGMAAMQDAGPSHNANPTDHGMVAMQDAGPSYNVNPTNDTMLPNQDAGPSYNGFSSNENAAVGQSAPTSYLGQNISSPYNGQNASTPYTGQNASAPYIGQNASTPYTVGQHPNVQVQPTTGGTAAETGSQYGEWMAPMAAGTGGAVLGAAAVNHHHNHEAPLEPTQDLAHTQEDAIDTAKMPVETTDMERELSPERSISRPRAFTESTQATTAAYSNAPTGTSIASTVPTSIAADEPLVPASTILTSDSRLFDENGTYIGPRTSASAATEYTLRPKLQPEPSSLTISHFHVPGEFPGNDTPTTFFSKGVWQESI